MSGHYQLLKMLRDQGHRLTPQREMVILALHEANGHLSAEEIHARVQKQNPCVDVSTTYRTLELLREMGIVSQFQSENHLALYELSVRSPHHHLICKQCKAVIDMDQEDLAGLKQFLLARYGFKADLDHCVIEGVCARCSVDGAAAPQAAATNIYREGGQDAHS